MLAWTTMTWSFEGHYQAWRMVWHTKFFMWSRMINCHFDTVDAHFQKRIACKTYKNVLGDAKPNYLIIQHMEPDHSANDGIFMENYPIPQCGKRESIYHHEAILWMWLCRAPAASQKKKTLERKTYTYICLQHLMVHLAKMVMTYDSYAKYSSAQMHLEKFGALDVEKTGLAKQDVIIFEIVGKYGGARYRHFLRLPVLNIQTICPLHGPSWTKIWTLSEPGVGLWSAYEPER